MLFEFLAASAGEAAPIAYGTDPSIPWGRLILAFAFSIAVAIAAIAFIRMRNGLPVIPDQFRKPWHTAGTGKPVERGERMAIVERLTVTPTSQIVVLRRGRQNYLLHLSANGATEIDRFETEMSPEEEGLQ